jgi:two-component system, NtrC family, nitrogen regulation sensor histidine kinase GlnL
VDETENSVLMAASKFGGLESLSSAVMLLDSNLAILYLNPMAEQLFELSRNHVHAHELKHVLIGAESLAATARHALDEQTGFLEHEIVLGGGHQPSLQLSCTITPVELEDAALLLEFRPLSQQLKIAREERIIHDQQLNRQLIRNLAHEIRNPLGGIKGAAQLLERELDRKELREYTQVIVKETDRLQSLMDRLVAPQRPFIMGQVNIHEVLERVRSLILAEYPTGLEIKRDYDLSLPDLTGDREQLIQSVLNIARNAAQALNGAGLIQLRSRVARQVTLAKRRYRLALNIEIIDNGPGIPADLKDRIFFPLVSGREGGTGLGLMLAQSFVNQHRGMIEFESAPGATRFSLLLPLLSSEHPSHEQRSHHETRLDY